MKKRYTLLFLAPLIGAIINCSTVTSRLQPDISSEWQQHKHVRAAAQEVSDDASAANWPYLYTPAQVYRDALWAVEMGWYAEEELAPPTRPLATWEVSDTASFLYSDTDSDRQVKAVLRYITPHFYMWFEEEVSVSDGDIAWAAEQMENEVYPKVRSLFGEEWSPGIDGDVHIFVLHLAQLSDHSYGEFGSGDECPETLCSFSNGHEIIYLTLDDLGVGTDQYLGVLAHELQHAVSYNTDGNESNWLNEGLSTLAETASGHGELAGDFVPDFLANPDLQLNDWPSLQEDDGPNYGAAYLFSLYLYERFGEEFIRSLARQAHDDITGVEMTLHEHAALPFEQVFGEWAVANLLDDSELANGQFGYLHEELPSLKITASHSENPAEVSTTVHQYAADYVALNFRDDLRLTFDGSEQTALLPTSAHSGNRFWWSNRLDNSIASLQTQLDLTGLSNPKARFWMWYDTEMDWDAVMIQISVDEGQSWEIVKGQHSGENAWWEYMYTGQSGDSGSPKWVEEEIDLRRWGGKSVILRVQSMTDSVFSGPGFAFDDFVLESDEGRQRQQDFETNADGWEASGFIYAGEAVRQHWAVYIVTLGAEPTITPLTLNEQNWGEIEIKSGGELKRSILVVAALAPFTLEAASYTYQATVLP